MNCINVNAIEDASNRSVLAVARRTGAAILWCVLALALSNKAQAATLYVSPQGSDSNPCTETLPCLTINHTVSVASSGETIQVAGGTYNVGTGLSITKNLNIIGASAPSTIIEGESVATVGTTFTLFVSNVTITKANGVIGAITVEAGGALELENMVVTNNKGFCSTGFGSGGITNFGVLVVKQSAITNNSTSCDGGGVANFGEATVIQSTISGNSAAGSNGGGIFSEDATLLVVNSTIAGNTSAAYGGGIEVVRGAAILDNVTIAYNLANKSHLGGSGGGIAISSGFNSSVTLVDSSNTILAGNLVSIQRPPYIVGNDCFTDSSSSLVSEGHDLLEFTNSCDFVSYGTDLTGVSAKLGPLQGNGGPTQTILPQAGSPAIDGANPAGCRDPLGNILTIDQRGSVRPDNGELRCDIGAVEAQ